MSKCTRLEEKGRPVLATYLDFVQIKGNVQSRQQGR
jgi:hypothetical protein